MLGEFFRANRPCAGLGCSAVHFRLAADGGFAPLGARWRRVGVLMMQFPRCVAAGLRFEAVWSPKCRPIG